PATHLALGAGEHRRTGKHLAAFAADEIRQRDENAVLIGDVPRQAIPPAHTRRPRHVISLRREPARRWSSRHEENLGAVQRGHGRRHAVPRVLADEERGTAPRRVERPNLTPAFDETLLVE